MASYQHKHLESQVLNILNYAIKNESYDESLKFCSFTAVKISADHSKANVFVDCFDRKKIDKMVEKLNIAKGFFRTQLARKLRIHHVPIVNFIKDQSIDNFLKINILLDNIKK